MVCGYLPAQRQVVASSGDVVTGGNRGKGLIMGFAYAKEWVPNSLAGTVSGVYNMGVMMAAMILHSEVGLKKQCR